MSGLKRKASAASPYEPRSKLSKERSSMSAHSPPGLRRAPTLTLDDSSPTSSLTGKKSLSKKASVTVGEVVTVPSLPKTASIVEGVDVVTTLTRLSSGSSIGRTTSFGTAPAAISKELSSSSVSKVPLVAKSISKGGSIVLDIPSLSKTSSKSKSVASVDAGVPLEKVLSLSKSLSKPSLTKEKSASLIVAAAEEAAAEAEAEKEEEEEEEEAAVTRDIPLPPGGLMEIVFSFDTTGSMYSVLDQIRGRIQDMVQRLQADIPGIRIAIFAHGDYCDKNNYIVQWIDFGANTPEICKFVKEVARTGGGDFPEAYEVVLRRCQSVLSWTPGSQRSLVMIGDATPHEASDPQNEENIDWKTECKALAEFGVRIYSVQALNNTQATKFYKDMASITRGRHLKLDQFSNVFDIIMAICYRERGDDFLEAYEDEVRDRHGGGSLNRDLEGLFGTLRDDTPISAAFPTPKGAKKAKKETAKVKAIKKLKGVIMAKGAAKKTKGVGKKTAAAKKTKVSKKEKPKKKTKKTIKAKKIQTGKYDKNKHPRENLFDSKFARGPLKSTVDSESLRDISWTKWHCGMFPEKKGRSVNIKARAKGAPGFVKANLFNRQNDVQAIYEIGVRPPSSFRGRVYATMLKPTTGFDNSYRWDRYLISANSVRQEINDILSRGGYIMVRRGVLPGKTDKEVDEAIQTIMKLYDYAWNRHGDGPRPHRIIRKANRFLISGAECGKAVKKTKKGTAHVAAPAKKPAAKKSTKKAAKAKPKATKPKKAAKGKKQAKGKKAAKGKRSSK